MLLQQPWNLAAKPLTHSLVEVLLPRYTWHGLIRKFALVPRVTRKIFLKTGSYYASIKSLENPKELLLKNVCPKTYD